MGARVKPHLLAVVAAACALFSSQTASAEAAGGTSATASVFARSDAPVHGIAADRRFVFVTKPAIEPGASSSVVALDARTGRPVAKLPAPPGGFRFPFALRVPNAGRLAVLDNAGFPPQGAPKLYEYDYTRRGRFSASLRRTVDFAGLPGLFAEDLEALPGGGYVVSESVVGGLWLVSRSGRIRPGLVPEGMAPLPKLGGCAHTVAPFSVGNVPFAPMSDFVPGVGSLTVSAGRLYFGSSCLGGLHELRLATLKDTTRPAAERALEIKTVSPRPAGVAFESLKGLVVDPVRARPKWIYAGDPFRLRLIRINRRSGERQVLSRDSRMFNFSVAATILPRSVTGGRMTLLVASDQEYRWAGLNSALTENAFESPFLVTKYPLGGKPESR